MLRLDLLAADAQQEMRHVPIERFAGKTILVTGASGIIGTHLLFGLQHCKEVHDPNLRVLAVVRRNVPEHLVQLEKGGAIQFLCGDLSDPYFLATIPPADLIIHGATYGQPGRFLAEAVTTIKLNTTVTMGLLEKLTPNGQFLFISTSEVYSGLESPPYSEEMIGLSSPSHPRSSYIESKRCGEAICQAFRASGVDAKSARLCLAYGPGSRRGDQRVLNSFIERGLRQGVIQLQDLGEVRRTYCYVADAVHMLWRVLFEGTDPVYNVGGVSSTTIVDLARLVGEYIRVPVQVPAAGSPGLPGAPSDARLNIARFEAQFGRMNFTDLPTGISRTVEWQRSLDDSP